MDWIDWISLATMLALPVVVFGGRYWIKTSIEKGIEHDFNAKIESLRAEFRRSEEAFKSELRLNESEISALRDGALSGRANRQALLAKRRLEAVDHLWAAFVELGPYKSVSDSMSIINFDSAAERAPNEPNLQKFFEILIQPIGDNYPDNSAAKERPFVTPIAWALFDAYRSVVFSACARAKLLAKGIKDAGSMMDNKAINNLLTAALPDFKDIIDRDGVRAHHYLLDILEKQLLAELAKILDGSEMDQESIQRAAEISNAARKANEDTKQRVERGMEIDPTILAQNK